MKLKNRVYGVSGIRAKMSNWNADFTGRPKTTSKNIIFGSDKAFKFPMKYQWLNEGEKVLYIKSYKEEKDKVQPRSLKERYELIFEAKIDNKTKTCDVLKNLFNAIDVMNFGATFAEQKQNISITGAVQIGQGMNIYDDTRVEVQDILSPFRNSKSDDAGASSLGTKIIADEAHYCYPFTINPYAYDEYVNVVKGFEGYTVEAYEKFKDGVLRGATAFATNSKFGCENEYAIFITLKEGVKLSLPSLDNFIVFKKEQDKNILDCSKLNKLFSPKVLDNVECIEAYIDEYNLKIVGLDNVKLHNIYTREVI